MSPPQKRLTARNLIGIELNDGLKDEEKLVATKCLTEIALERAALPCCVLICRVIYLNDATRSVLGLIECFIGVF